MNRRQTTWALLLAASLAAPFAGAQEATAPTTTTTESTTTAPTGEALNATVTSVRGTVRYRLTESDAWQKATVGLVLPPGAEFQTGLRSAVQFTLPGGQTVTLDRLGEMKILTAIQEQGKITTDLGMKFGRTRWDIEKAGVEYSNTIRSPGATLAIRGTKVIYEDQAPWVPSAISTEGRAAFRNMRRQFIAFGGTKKAEIRSDKQSPGQTALDGSRIDPKTAFAGRDAAEEKIITELPGLAGLDPGSQNSVIQVSQQLSGPGSSFVGIPATQGPLDFVLGWQSVNLATGNAGPTNLDLLITDPNGAILSKASPQIGSGSAIGRFNGDSTGPNGTGSETARWNELFPQGTYTFTVNHVSGDPAQVIVNVTRNGRDIKTVGGDARNPLIMSPGDTFTSSVDLIGSDLPTPVDAPPAKTKLRTNRKK